MFLKCCFIDFGPNFLNIYSQFSYTCLLRLSSIGSWDGSCDGSDGGVTSGGFGVGDSGAVADEFGWGL